MKTLKQGRSAQAAAEETAKIRTMVEGVLADIAERGDGAVRELSIKFDGWDRIDYRLTDEEIRDCLGQLSKQAIEDIEFAQSQVRNFAEKQKECLTDLEVETRRALFSATRIFRLVLWAVTYPAANIPCWPRRTCRSSLPKWRRPAHCHLRSALSGQACACHRRCAVFRRR